MPKQLLVLFAGILLLSASLTFFLPGSFRTERRVVIAAKPSAIYSRLADLKKWPSWTPWHKHGDPSTRWTFEGTPGVGQSASVSGDTWRPRRITITQLERNAALHYDVAVGGVPAHGSLWLNKTAEGTEVVWRVEGDLEGLDRWREFFIDEELGLACRTGLDNLKERVEKSAGAGADETRTPEASPEPPNED